MDHKCILNENVALHDIVACQNWDALKFDRKDRSNALYLKDITDLESLLKSGFLRFRYLKVEVPDENTELFMKHSEFVHNRSAAGTIGCLEQCDLVEICVLSVEDLKIAKSLKRPKVVLHYTHRLRESFEPVRWIWENLVIPNINLHLNYSRSFTVGDVYVPDFEEAVEEFHWFLGFANCRVNVHAVVTLEVNKETTKEQIRVAKLMVEKIGYENIQSLSIRTSSEELIELPFTVASKMINLERLHVNCRFAANFNTLGNLNNTKLNHVSVAIYDQEWLLHGIPPTASVSPYDLEWQKLMDSCDLAWLR